jgi:hypothetical protein
MAPDTQGDSVTGEIRRQVIVSLRNFVGTPLPVATLSYLYYLSTGTHKGLLDLTIPVSVSTSNDSVGRIRVGVKLPGACITFCWKPYSDPIFLFPLLLKILTP